MQNRWQYITSLGRNDLALCGLIHISEGSSLFTLECSRTSSNTSNREKPTTLKLPSSNLHCNDPQSSRFNHTQIETY